MDLPHPFFRYPYHSFTFSNYSLKTFMSNLVSLTCSSPLMLEKIQTGILPVSEFLFKWLINRNCLNSSSSNDIDVWNLDHCLNLSEGGGVMFRRNYGKTLKLGKNDGVKNIAYDVMMKNYDPIVIFLIYGRFGGIWKPVSELKV